MFHQLINWLPISSFSSLWYWLFPFEILDESVQCLLHWPGPSSNGLYPFLCTKNRLDWRGFNQASEIGNVLTKHCGVSISHCALSRTQNTMPQTSMSSTPASKTNLRKAFDVSKSDSPTGVTHIAPIDDVITTMATTQVISKMLRAQQNCRIDVWCLADARKTLWSTLNPAKGHLRELNKTSQPELSRMTKPIAELRKTKCKEGCN